MLQLGQRIAILRQQQRMTQKELAAAIAVSASAIGMYEQNRREPSAEKLLDLARVLDVTVDFLLTGH